MQCSTTKQRIYYDVARPRLLRPVIVMTAMGIRRRTLQSSRLGCVEDFSAPGDRPAPCGSSPEHQLVLPHSGAFELVRRSQDRAAGWKHARRVCECWGKTTPIVMLRAAGHDSRIRIITPRLLMFDETAQCGRASSASRLPARRGTDDATHELAK